MDYITLMAKKTPPTKSDWMLEKWAEANGYLDDPEPSVELALKEEAEKSSIPPDVDIDEYEGWTPNLDFVSLRDMEKFYQKHKKGDQELEGEFCFRHHKMYDEHTTAELDVDTKAAFTDDFPEDPFPHAEGVGGWDFDCPKCNGTGKIGDNECDRCEGTGGVYESGKHYGEEEARDFCGEKCCSTSLWGKCACGDCDICSNVEMKEYSQHSLSKYKEAGKEYAGTCTRCGSDNTKKTKSQAGTTIGLCNDCGETWKLKEAPELGGQKGGEIPLGKAGPEKPIEKKPLQSQTSAPTESPMKGETEGHCDNCGSWGNCREYEDQMLCQNCRTKARQQDEKNRQEEPDPSNPDKELNPNPEIPSPVDGEGGEKPKEPNEPTKPTQPTSDDDSQIHMKPQTYSADGVDLPDKIEIPERLYNDLMMMVEYSITNDNEAGGFLIIAEHGNLGVVGEQFGENREIVLEPNEALHEGESLIGTVHMHPVTPTASTGDVTGYLNDENEKVMVVVGADKSINFFFKVPDMTHEGDYGDEISDNFEQSDMDIMAEGFGFIWYRGEESDRTELHLMDNVIEDIEFNVLDEIQPVEEVVKALGIKGRPDIPPEYSTKKTPMRVQIPFAFRCKDGKLTG